MKISYAITVCNELEEIKKLIDFLHTNKRPEDEICVLLDKPKASHVLIDWLYRYSSSNWITLKEGEFKGHFADWKNQLMDMCTGDFIFQIDADELPSQMLIDVLPQLLESNPDNELYLVPRVNTVEGLTLEHIQKWGWRVNEKGWVNFPDYQTRIMKNIPEIKWINKVHERLDGFKSYAALPLDMGFEDCYLIHPKTIERQEKQNNFYDTL
jgi:hypothetical protein